MAEDMLIDKEEYLEAGVNVGSRRHVDDMERFVFRVKKNNLAIIDLDQTDDRIRRAASLLSEYDPEDVLVVCRKPLGHQAVVSFAEATGTQRIFGRFMPGTLTNPRSDDFVEPEVLVVTDPEEDRPAVIEAVDANIPVIALADTANSLEYIDLAVPANNKGEQSVALLYYLLARELLKARGELDDEDDFGYTIDDFAAEGEEDDSDET